MPNGRGLILLFHLFIKDPTMKQNLKDKDFLDLGQCNKFTFSNGEKKKFSGVYKQWYSCDAFWKGARNHFFIYTQPLIFLFEEVPEQERFNKTRRQLIDYCLKNKIYTYPIYAYNQRILVARIYEYGINRSNRFEFVSGDDDVYPQFTFPSEEIPNVKRFFENHYRDHDLGDKLVKLEHFYHERTNI